MTGLAPLIAVIGADGAGKSTLAADLAGELRKKCPAEHVYLGLGSGPIGHKIAALPLIGPLLDRLAGEDYAFVTPTPATHALVSQATVRRPRTSIRTAWQS